MINCRKLPTATRHTPRHQQLRMRICSKMTNGRCCGAVLGFCCCSEMFRWFGERMAAIVAWVFFATDDREEYQVTVAATSLAAQHRSLHR